MTYHKYVVTAQKPTAIQFAVKGSFTSANETNLILGKGTRIEVYTTTPEGLKSTIEFSINGSLCALRLYTPRDRDKASLMLITSRYKYCVLSYDESSQQIITESSGEIGYPGQPRNETLNSKLVIDPTGKYFAATLFESTVTIVIPDFTRTREHTAPQPIRKISLRTKENRRRQTQDLVFYHPHDYMNISLPDKHIVSLAFLQDSFIEPRLLILYDDSIGRRYIQMFTLDVKNRLLIPGEIVMDHFESDANLLISMPGSLGGVVLIAGKFIRYLRPDQPPKAIGIRPSTITCYSIMNESGTRVLLGDAEGMLHLLTLNLVNNRVDSLCFIALGSVSIPSCLAYLENDIVFVGSTVGDSQVIHIQASDTDSAENGEILNVIEEFSNIGPITDFCVADLDKQGQTQLITCSGVAKDSSLRIIRNGVGLNELATIEISGIKGCWALRSSFFEKYDDMLVISFLNQTCLLALKENAMTQLTFHSAMDLNNRTLMTTNVIDDLILQVTDKSVRLMEAKHEGLLLDEWFPQDKVQITVASINPTQCVLSTGYGKLIALGIEHRRLTLLSTVQLQDEISCIDISPIDPNNPYSSNIVAVGKWENVGVCLLTLPHLELIAEEPLSGTVMPRSILMAMFENICYLLVALGDGQFYNFKLNNEGKLLDDKKRSFFGKSPIHLSKFTSNGTTHVFVSSDKPSVIHSRNKKLVYSNVNLKEIRCAASFNSVSFPDAVALITSKGLLIGQMEEIQKLHITKIPTIDTPRRITYQETSRTFGIVTERITSEPYTATTTTGGFEILDDQSFLVLDRIYFKRFERPLAATTMTFEDDKHEYYILATGKETDEYENKSYGRIIVFQVTSERKLKFIHQIRTDGMVDCLRPFLGNLLVSVRGMVYIYKWEHGTLMLVCSKRLPSITESITTVNGLIIAGDMVYSIVTLKYDAKTETLTEVAAHERLKEILAIEAADENLYVAAERDGHLFVVEKCQDDGSNDEPLLETVSVWHLGDSVRKFRYGSLGMSSTDPDLTPEASTLIFATASGAIGLITDLTAERFKLLDQMQYNMTRVVKSIGDLSHIDWRSVSIMDRKDEAVNFIDGDLIESFLDLTPQQMQNVVDGVHGGRKLDKTVEELCKVVEELMSVHP